MKKENPIEEVWRIREELADEEGCDVHTVFEILRREEKKHGNRVRSLHKAENPVVLREKSPKPE
jgi:hypothetical protein